MKVLEKMARKAAISTEVAISIALVTVVAIIAIGLFSDNVKEMVTNGNFQNIFNASEKTDYAAYNRDYTDSQINVQIMGEQGLAMLRQTANNKVLDIIGTTPTATDANTVGYLVLAIEAIVGQPDICVKMKKESAKTCNDKDANIGGYNYKVDITSISSGLIAMTKVNTEGTPVSPTIKLSFKTTGNTVDTILSSSVKTASSIGTTNTSETSAKFKFIKDLTISIKDFINSNAMLMNPFNVNKSSLRGRVEEVRAALQQGILPGVQKSSKESYRRCYCVKLVISRKYACGDLRRSQRNGCAKDAINDKDKDYINDWTNKKIEQLSDKNLTVDEMIALITKDPDLQTLIHKLEQDQDWGDGHTPSCAIFNQINELAGTKAITCTPIQETTLIQKATDIVEDIF